MKLTLRPLAAGLAAATIAGGVLLAAGGAAHAATKPPWEPDGNSAGGLVFYNSAGHVITGGSVDDSPLAAYVEGTSSPRPGDKLATLFAYTPVLGLAPGAWSGEALTASIAYPNAAAPAPLKTSKLPLVTGAAGDESIGVYVSDFPNKDTSTTDGYSGIYQIRLLTSAPGESGSATYDSADIEVTGSTWSVVYTTSPAAATKAVLAVSPAASAYHGATVKLTATVTPAAATGSVQFRDGAKLLKSVPLASGHATYSLKTLSDATHKLTAVFVPTGSAFAGSTSVVHSLVVKAHPTKTTLKASRASIKQGAKLTLSATETPAVAGTVTFYDGSKKLGAAKVAKGKAKLATAKLKVGTHKLKAKFVPTATVNDAASVSKVIKVVVKS